MNRSRLSSLKIIARMLAIDSELHAKERAWFTSIVRAAGATVGERMMLADILEGRSNIQINELLAEVDTKDKDRLLTFIRVAMRQDGLVRNKEIQFFYEVQKQLESLPEQNDYLPLGRLILKRERQLGMWRDLNRLGRLWGGNIRAFGVSGHYFYYGEGLFLESVADLLSFYKYKVITGVILLIIIVALTWSALFVHATT